MNTEIDDDDVDDCIPCKLQAGIKMMIESCIAYKFKDTKCLEIQNDLLNGTIDLNDAINDLLNGARKTPESHQDFDAILEILKEDGIIKDA